MGSGGVLFRSVVLLEAGDAPGGRVRSDRVDGFTLDRGFQVLLTGYPELTRQHLYWTAITEILSKRTLTIIDPDAAGRQHLWMSNPVPELMGPALPGDSLKRPLEGR